MLLRGKTAGVKAMGTYALTQAHARRYCSHSGCANTLQCMQSGALRRRAVHLHRCMLLVACCIATRCSLHVARLHVAPMAMRSRALRVAAASDSRWSCGLRAPRTIKRVVPHDDA